MLMLTKKRIVSNNVGYTKVFNEAKFAFFYKRWWIAKIIW